MTASQAKNRHGHVDDVRRFRALCEQSKRRFPIPDVTELLPAGIGLPTTRLGDELSKELGRESPTDFDTHDLRRVGSTFTLEHAIGEPSEEWAVVIRAIASCLSAGTRLPDLGNPVWSRIVDLGRGLVEAKAFDLSDPRTTAVAAAGARLVAQGFGLAARGGSYRFGGGAATRATREIQSGLDQLGQVNVLRAIFECLRKTDRAAYGLYMPVRSYGHDRSEPSYPYGFLVHLAVRSVVYGQRSRDTSRKRGQAFGLARDLVAALNVEPYNSFGLMNASPKRIGELLRELALFDHLFAFPQQWPAELAPMALTEFFRWDGASALWDRLGWSIVDVLALYKTVVGFGTRDPVLIARGEFAGTDMPAERVERMLAYFTHGPEEVNAGYDSPLAARKANLMFKPLIQVKSGKFLLPAVSFAGPAFYEAIMVAIRRHTKRRHVEDLQGRGTERVVGRLLEESELRVAARNAHYEVGGGGECDFVVESESHVLFVECKAKALTRGAMAGVEGDALLDFGGGMFAAQAQAMRHERVLRQGKRIDFVDGTPPLLLRERTVFRLSVTLLDHGSLQDRMVLWTLFDALLHSEVKVSGEYGKRRQVEGLNRTLDRMREEAIELEALGVERRIQARNCVSMSVGSLYVLLKEIGSLEEFVAVAASAVTYAIYNPVFEWYQLRKSGLVSV